MRDRVSVPVRMVDGERWGDLNVLASTHEICGEVVKCKNEKFSFAGQHRVRLFQFKKNVHWKIPEGIDLDITNVLPGAAPRRRQG